MIIVSAKSTVTASALVTLMTLSGCMTGGTTTDFATATTAMRGAMSATEPPSAADYKLSCGDIATRTANLRMRYDAIEEDLKSGQRSISLSPLALAQWAQRESVYNDEAGAEHLGVLRTQPYEQAISYLEGQGEGMKANQLRFWKNWHRTKAQFASGWSAPLGVASLVWLGLTIYGIVPAVAFLWFVLLVLWGMRLARQSAGFAGEAKQSRSDRFWYSLENALPLLELSETHKKISHDNRSVEQKFHLQKILGFVLASVLVGALALI